MNTLLMHIMFKNLINPVKNTVSLLKFEIMHFVTFIFMKQKYQFIKIDQQKYLIQ